MPFREEWFDGWRQGDKAAFNEACAWLWNRLYNVAHHYLTKLGVDEDLARDLASDAFWDAMEELDLMINGGRFLTMPLAEPGKEGKVRGLMSGRELSLREPMEWRGEREFVALVRRIWILRCLDRLRQWDPVSVVLLSLVIEAEGDEEEVISEEELPGELSSLEQWLLDREGLLWFIRNLARASEQLKDHPACREIVEATIIYIKWKVAQCNPQWKHRSLDEIAIASIDGLVKDADLRAFDANGAEWHQFLMDVLDLSRNTLDQRVRRCLQVLIPIMFRLRKEQGED